MSHRFASAASLVALVAGHGMMTLPASRNGGTLDKAGVHTGVHDEAWHTASWFTTTWLTVPVPHETNCDDAYATIITCKECSATVKPEHQNLCRNTPWRAPGLAGVVNPCGCFAASSGGYSTGCTPGDKRQAQSLGTQLPKTQRTRWTAGGTAHVAFSSSANHGGGYAYRLCPAGAEQTEECFQNHHLEFVGGNSIVEWTTGEKLKIAALTLSSGTHPANSQWRAIRIPGCGGLVLPGNAAAKSSSHDFCSPPLLPTQGIKIPSQFHGDKLNSESYWDFSIKDKVAVPNLPSGDYTLSWRWDTEINPQVWQNCADIEIVGGTMNQTLSRGDLAV